MLVTCCFPKQERPRRNCRRTLDVLSTRNAKMIGYFVAIFPLYIFVYLPISNSLFRASDDGSRPATILNGSFIASDDPLSCPAHTYNTFILSLDPLMVYIENFVSAEESAHLLAIRYYPPLHPAFALWIPHVPRD